MMLNYHFHFDELNISRQPIAELLGFGSEEIPEPFNTYLDEAFEEARQLCTIQGAVVFTNEFQFASDYSSFTVEGKTFECGRLISHQLKTAKQLAFFICTAGEGISRRSKEMLHGDDPAKGYVYDVLGSVTVETAMDRIQEKISIEMQTKKIRLSNRYSPGYCDWSVQDQHKLFSFFPENHCGIKLNDSALMHPIKSVSGVLAAGPEVKYHQYHCDNCQSSTCIYRNLRNRMG